ncbi:MAG TPA: hypothetical protein VFH80_17690 [Solirubrobacteraceae bacterium]|nr:hypothetical protein [Solirubrobacteraceae bacterium]
MAIATRDERAPESRADTSNTIQFGGTSTALDQARQPAVVSGPATGTRLMEEEGIYPRFA